MAIRNLLTLMFVRTQKGIRHLQTLVKPAPKANMHWVWSYVMKYRVAAYGSLITGFIGGLTAALEPYVIGLIIDHVRYGFSPAPQPAPLNTLFDFIRVQTAPGMIVRDIAMLIGFAIITVIAFIFQRNYSGTIAYSVLFDMRRDLFDNLLTLEQGFYHRHSPGDLISRMYSDLDTAWRLLVMGFTRFGSAFFTLMATFVLLATVNLPLTIVVFIVLTVSTGFQMYAGKSLAPVYEKVQDQAGDLAALVQDAFSGIQTIKTFGREQGVNRRYAEENAEYRRRWLFFKRRNEPVGMLPNMISQLAAGVVVLFGGILALNGQLSLGNFTQFLLYLGMISNVLLQLGTIYQRYQQTRGALVRITPLLQPAKIASPSDAKSIPDAQGDIVFDHVTVEMDGTRMLDDVSLHIPAGQVTALVGSTGSGKTLLVNLLARVLDPTEGRVLVDGLDVRELKLDELRQHIAYVPQSTFLFSATLAENVHMNRPGVDEPELTKAMTISRLSNDLAQLPHGLETLVGEKGVMLSGGQKQRVAIARAIVRDPAILVLDDALSSVDTRTSADILGELRHVLKSRTSLIIAHRIATVKDADHIVVLADGRIVEQGTHQALIARNGAYARMVDRELKDDRRPEEIEEANAHVRKA